MAFLARRDRGGGEQGLPRGIVVRRGNANDEYAAFEVMRRAMGYEVSWAHHAAIRHHLRNSPGSSFWVTEEAPRFSSAKMIGCARSVVREGVWSLTEFFVLPEYHRQGIGKAMLARCLEDGALAGAETRFILASQNGAADSLYVRLAGCFPRIPMLLLVGAADKLRVTESAEIGPILEVRAGSRALRDTSRTETPGTLLAEPLILTPETQATLNTLDREIVGYARPPEHTHWASEMGGTKGAARLFRRPPTPGETEGPMVGYAYMGPHSSGPALALDPAELPRMVAHVAGLARSVSVNSLDRMLSGDQYLAIAGTNEVMLRWLLQCGWNIVFQYLFMSSRPFGKLDRYVGHTPLYLL